MNDAGDNSPEAALLAAAQRGSTSAFTRLVEAYQARVRGYLARWVGDPATVDDLAQEVFLAAWRGLAGFDGGVPIGAWFAGIARNQALMHLRSESRRRARSGDVLDAALHDWRQKALESDGERLALRLGEVDALRRCLDGLAAHQRALIEAHYVAGRSCHDLARERDQEDNAVRMAMLRIRQSLRTCLERRLGGDTGEGAFA
jgi:RNA polymerase sigma-70 factor (ECF subfamily)